MYLEAEIADVSIEGIVHFQNVSLANVTLQHGAVVSTTLNDYQFAVGYYLTYYAEDDANYDVPLEVVRPSEQSMWGQEFLIRNSSMSDCVYLMVRPGTVYPGCPPESVAGRARIKARSAPLPPGTAPLGVPAYAAYANYYYADAPDAASIDYMDNRDEALLSHPGIEYPYFDYDMANDPGVWFVARFLDLDSPWIAELRQVRGHLCFH